MTATLAANSSDWVAIMFVKAELLIFSAYSSGGITTVIQQNHNAYMISTKSWVKFTIHIPGVVEKA